MSSSEPPDERIAVSIAATGYLRIGGTHDINADTPVLVVTHGYGQPPERLLAYGQAVMPNAVVVAPEGPAAFYRRPRSSGGASQGGIGYGWLADPRRADAERRNDDLIEAALRAAASTTGASTARVFLLGFSQGVGVATHFAVRNPTRVRALIGLAGGVPMAWRDDLRALSATPVLWVTGTEDHAYVPAYNEILVAHWRTTGAAFEHQSLESGHDLVDAARPNVERWLAGVLSRG